MRYLLPVFFLYSISTGFAQDTIATYFDYFGNPTTINRGFFFRSKINPSKPTKTYCRKDSLYESPAFKPAQISEKNGRFIFLDEKKRVVKDVMFKENKLNGQALTFYENGTISDVEFFKNDLQDSIATYYHKNGTVSAIEHYKLDSLISYELFNEDGTKDTVTTSTKINAEFPGGQVEMRRFLANNIIYPQSAIELNIEGKCYLQFQVDETGNIFDIQVVLGVPDCQECDSESIRVVSEMPRWSPAKMHNRYCTTMYNLPISFKLMSGGKKKRRRN